VLRNAWIPAAIVALLLISRRLENPSYKLDYYAQIIELICVNVTLAISLHLINGLSGQFSLGHAGFMAVGAYLAGYAAGTYGSVSTPDGPADFANPLGVLVYFLIVGISLAAVAGAVVILAWLVRLTGHWHRRLPVMLCWIVIVWAFADVVISQRIDTPGAYLIWYQSALAMWSGFNRLLTWVPMPAASANLSAVWRGPVTMFLLLSGGGIMAAAAGFLVGLPTLRLRGDYLAIATLGFAKIISDLINICDPLGGARGLSVPVYHLDDGSHTVRFFFPWAAGTALMMFVAARRLQRSPQGLELTAVREDEIAAAACGINTTRNKVFAFVVGAFGAGVAGVLFGHSQGFLATNSFGFMKSVEIVVMVTLGGLGNLWGATIAAIALTTLPYILDDAPDLLPHFQTPAKWLHDNKMFVFALLLIVVMVAKPRVREMFSRRSRVS
jgi:branched-chain amino acid transport system permease protein